MNSVSAVNFDKRSQFLDYLKGILTILVVTGHTIQYCYRADYATSSDFFDNFLFKFIYSFHMPLFALVSGYLFYYTIKKRRIKELAENRFKTLLLPIIIWGSLSFLFRLFVGKYTDLGTYDLIKRYISHLVSTLWFLWAVLLCSVIIALVHYFFNDNRIVMFLLIIIFFITPDKYNLGYTKFLYPFFAGGYLWNELAVKVNSKKTAVVCIASGVLYIPLYIFMNRDTYIYTSGITLLGKEHIANQLYNDAYRWLIGLVGSVFIVSITKLLFQFTKERLSKIDSSIAAIGSISMGIYAIQNYLFSDIVAPLFNRMKINIPFYIVIFEAALVLAVCVFATKLIKKVKFLNILLLGGR